MPNFGYHLARAEGAAFRKIYAASLPLIVRRSIKVGAVLPFEVYGYSGENALPEQVASIRSFLRYAGRPKKFTVVSDGTYSKRSVATLQSIDPTVAVVQRAVRSHLISDEKWATYLSEHPTGKQLALIMSLPAAGPALYLDSDVLFFPGAEMLRALDITRDYYLPDCQLSADERLFRSVGERACPVNTGVLFLARELDWSLARERFRELDGAPNFFTNQSMTHLAMHANGVAAFDSRQFVLQLDDQFIYPDRYANPAIVLRHYVNPVRHKFWTPFAR
jgi:hypothetical protein